MRVHDVARREPALVVERGAASSTMFDRAAKKGLDGGPDQRRRACQACAHRALAPGKQA